MAKAKNRFLVSTTSPSPLSHFLHRLAKPLLPQGSSQLLPRADSNGTPPAASPTFCRPHQCLRNPIGGPQIDVADLTTPLHHGVDESYNLSISVWLGFDYCWV
uniref:Uncharacterized protein n=1 Tax=Cannabis sativa TaxID=3483 RepID=A0A803NJF8_CANSA